MSASLEDDRPPELVAASTETTRLASEQTVVQIPVPTEAKAVFVEAVHDDSRRVFLRVEDITVDTPPAASYNVFFVPHDAPAIDVANYLGTVTFFGIEMRDVPGHDEAVGFRKVFDVTDAFARNARDLERSDQVSVGFVPVRVETSLDDDESRRLEEEQTATIEQANIRVGRVAIYVT